jgi:hypothetical protein
MVEPISAQRMEVVRGPAGPPLRLQRPRGRGERDPRRRAPGPVPGSHRDVLTVRVRERGGRGARWSPGPAGSPGLPIRGHRNAGRRHPHPGRDHGADGHGGLQPLGSELGDRLGIRGGLRPPLRQRLRSARGVRRRVDPRRSSRRRGHRGPPDQRPVPGAYLQPWFSASSTAFGARRERDPLPPRRDRGHRRRRAVIGARFGSCPARPTWPPATTTPSTTTRDEPVRAEGAIRDLLPGPGDGAGGISPGIRSGRGVGPGRLRLRGVRPGAGSDSRSEGDTTTGDHPGQHRLDRGPNPGAPDHQAGDRPKLRAFSGSIATLWDFAPDWTLGASLARSFRNPSPSRSSTPTVPIWRTSPSTSGALTSSSEVGTGLDLFLRGSRRRTSAWSSPPTTTGSRITSTTSRRGRPSGSSATACPPDHPRLRGEGGRRRFPGDRGAGPVGSRPESGPGRHRVLHPGGAVDDSDPLPFIPPLGGRFDVRYEGEPFFGSLGMTSRRPQNRVPAAGPDRRALGAAPAAHQRLRPGERRARMAPPEPGRLTTP